MFNEHTHTQSRLKIDGDTKYFLLFMEHNGNKPSCDSFHILFMNYLCQLPVGKFMKMMCNISFAINHNYDDMSRFSNEQTLCQTEIQHFQVKKK